LSTLEEQLELYAQSWRQEHEELSISKTKIRDLETELEQHRRAIADLNVTIQRLELEAVESKDLKKRMAAVETARRDLEARVNNPNFFKRDMLEPLALELEEVTEVLSGVAESTHPREDWQAFLDDWHSEIVEKTQQLSEGNGGEVYAARARHLILAQWVFVRWLEVANLFRS
jgi:chromosome segregation ATPase